MAQGPLPIGAAREKPQSRGRLKGHLYCDAFGCDEGYPLEHEQLGDPSFGTGRWLGWVYVDLNRPDLFDDVLRFCSTGCLEWWLWNQTLLKIKPPLSELDKALRAPEDEVKRRRAGLKANPAQREDGK